MVERKGSDEDIPVNHANEHAVAVGEASVFDDWDDVCAAGGEVEEIAGGPSELAIMLKGRRMWLEVKDVD